MTIRDAFPDIIATDDDDSIISRYTDAHDNELAEIEEELDEILVTFQLRQIDLYGQRPDSSYFIDYIDTDGNEQTLEVTSFNLVEDIPDVDEVISVFDDGREYILDGDYELFFIDGELEGIEWTPDNNNPSLDRIGQVFGEIGRRRGRNDRDYRRFLNSLVPVLSGRGQVPTLKEAVAISLGMDAESIGVDENFQELEFEIILSDFWEPHQGSAIESIVDRARPSGVEHVSTRYQVPDEELLGATDAATTDGEQVLAESETNIDSVLLGITIKKGYGAVYGKKYGDSENTRSNDEETDEVNTSSTRLRRWDASSWDSFLWDGSAFGEEIQSQVTLESDIDTFFTDQSNLSDGVVESVIISGKYGTTYGQSYGTSPLNEKPLSNDEETDEVNTSSTRLRRWDASSWDSFSWDGSAFGEEIQSQVTLEVTAQDEYGATYGEWYG